MRTAHAYPTRLRRAIAVSAVFHLALVVTLSIVPQAKFPFREQPLDVTWVELPRGTSDEIGLGMKKAESLPKSTIEEQKQLFQPEQPPQQNAMQPTKPPEMPKAPEAPKTIEPRPKMQIDDTKAKVRRAEEPPARKPDRAVQNALAKIDKQLRDRTISPEAAQIAQNTDGYKYGTGTKPLKVLPSDPEYLKYQATVRYKVMREWIIPERYASEGGNFNARLEVMINMDGEVTSIRWAGKSGNESFDQSAIRAVKKASPFPKPPDRLAWEAYNEGFLIEFDPRLKVRY